MHKRLKSRMLGFNQVRRWFKRSPLHAEQKKELWQPCAVPMRFIVLMLLELTTPAHHSFSTRTQGTMPFIESIERQWERPLIQLIDRRTAHISWHGGSVSPLVSDDILHTIEYLAQSILTAPLASLDAGPGKI